MQFVEEKKLYVPKDYQDHFFDIIEYFLYIIF